MSKRNQTKEPAEMAPSIEKAPNDISKEQRTQMIREAAYCLAERNGFQCDRALDDWLEAETEIDSWIASNS